MSIAGTVPTSRNYEEWTDSHISMQIPEGTKSGLVYVNTPGGRSEGVLFTNKSQVPDLPEDSASPGMPLISGISPESGAVGEIIRLQGSDFGVNRDAGQVYFTWNSGEKPANLETSDFSLVLPAAELDYDYLRWADKEITVKVPDGATSGNVFVVTSKGRSNSLYFEVEQPVGIKILRRRRTYSLETGVSIRNIIASGSENGLYIWVPRVFEGPEQRELEITARSMEPRFDNVNGLSLFHLEGLSGEESYDIKESFLLDRYAVETQVISVRAIPPYDSGGAFFRNYTRPDPTAPADEKPVADAAGTAVARENNPYNKAARVYRRVLALLESDENLRFVPAVEGLESGAGDAYTYASLMTGMLRAVDIPARVVAGCIIEETRNAKRHYWCEFFIQDFGWIPADPYLGDLSPEDQEYYFGNIDNRHVSFSKGLVDVPPMTPYGEKVSFGDAGYDKLYSLQKIYEESVGDLLSYSTSWYDVTVIGIY